MEVFLNFKWAFIATIICFFIYFIYDYLRLKLSTNKDIHFKNKDTEITESIMAKFPLVNPNFINKNQKEMAIENNQEIQEINKKLELMEDAIRINVKHIMELKENGQ